MNAGVTFERVYHSLKEQVTAGRFTPGQHLEPAALSKDLNASITPVRDALHRLAGEGLVETPRGEGFRMPQATEVGLRHLYRLNAALLDLAVRSRARIAPAPPAIPEETEAVDRAEHLFVSIAAMSANPELVSAIARLNDRLRAVRETELRLLDETDGELADIAGKLRSGEPRQLRRALYLYHRRRERRVDEIVAGLLAPR